MTHSLLSQRRYFFLVLSDVWIGWFAIMLHAQAWTLFRDNWFMTATMCVGSFIAGATSEGGGAVAFPVMTLLFGIEPSVARDFSLMIQSVGMTAASALIFCFGIKVEWRAILFAGIGGTLGIVLGLSLVAPGCEPSFVKMFFTSLTGSGLDIMTFTLLTLYFRVSEKVATPTSVVLMAGNAVVGFVWRGAVQRQLPLEAWNFWYVCIPVVVVGAPLGAYLIRSRTRHFVARLLYASIVVQFAAALVIVPQTTTLLLTSTGTFASGICLFGCMTIAGSKRPHRETETATMESRPGSGISHHPVRLGIHER